MSYIFFGPPGVGKGLMAKKVSKKRGIPHISTGDLLRNAVREGFSLGKKAHKYMQMGMLVPDDIVIKLLKLRIEKEDSKHGFILDGFPRTISQAKALDNSNIQINIVFDLMASDKTVMDRITGRRICAHCGAIFHIKNVPPEIDGVCNECLGHLYQREDDKPKTVKRRLEEYHKVTAPLRDFYRAKNILIGINTERPIPDILNDILSHLK
ncbi:MAG: adenylate kinase [Nanoarchaeota archaeon]